MTAQICLGTQLSTQSAALIEHIGLNGLELNCISCCAGRLLDWFELLYITLTLFAWRICISIAVAAWDRCMCELKPQITNNISNVPNLKNIACCPPKSLILEEIQYYFTKSHIIFFFLKKKNMSSPAAVKMSSLPSMKRQHLLAELYVAIAPFMGTSCPKTPLTVFVFPKRRPQTGLPPRHLRQPHPQRPLPLVRRHFCPPRPLRKCHPALLHLVSRHLPGAAAAGDVFHGYVPPTCYPTDDLHVLDGCRGWRDC